MLSCDETALLKAKLFAVVLHLDELIVFFALELVHYAVDAGVLVYVAAAAMLAEVLANDMIDFAEVDKRVLVVVHRLLLAQIWVAQHVLGVLFVFEAALVAEGLREVLINVAERVVAQGYAVVVGLVELIVCSLVLLAPSFIHFFGKMHTFQRLDQAVKIANKACLLIFAGTDSMGKKLERGEGDKAKEVTLEDSTLICHAREVAFGEAKAVLVVVAKKCICHHQYYELTIVTHWVPTQLPEVIKGIIARLSKLRVDHFWTNIWSFS